MDVQTDTEMPGRCTDAPKRPHDIWGVQMPTCAHHIWGTYGIWGPYECTGGVDILGHTDVPNQTDIPTCLTTSYMPASK